MLFRLDLHIHTPASSCYIDNVMPESGSATTPGQIVEMARSAGLDAIAITDHNTIKGIEPIRKMGERAGLKVFSGIELSARGGHILALWDRDTPVAKLDDLLSKLGFDGESEGKGFVETDFWMDTVFDRVHDAGGLAIAAHIDRKPKGFVASEELSLADKLKVYSHPQLNALEITIVRDKNDWNVGKGRFQPGKACIQGSDAHAPNEIGRRPIMVEMPDLSLASLGLAFREFGSRIFFPSDITSNR